MSSGFGNLWIWKNFPFWTVSFCTVPWRQVSSTIKTTANVEFPCHDDLCLERQPLPYDKDTNPQGHPLQSVFVAHSFWKLWSVYLVKSLRMGIFHPKYQNHKSLGLSHSFGGRVIITTACRLGYWTAIARLRRSRIWGKPQKTRRPKRGHYITNPTTCTIIGANPSKLYICSVWSPQNW